MKPFSRKKQREQEQEEKRTAREAICASVVSYIDPADLDKKPAAVEGETTAAVEEETTAAVEEETTAEVEEETTAAVEEETTAAVEEEKTHSVGSLEEDVTNKTEKERKKSKKERKKARKERKKARKEEKKERQRAKKAEKERKKAEEKSKTKKTDTEKTHCVMNDEDKSTSNHDEDGSSKGSNSGDRNLSITGTTSNETDDSVPGVIEARMKHNPNNLVVEKPCFPVPPPAVGGDPCIIKDPIEVMMQTHDKYQAWENGYIAACATQFKEHIFDYVKIIPKTGTELFEEQYILRGGLENVRDNDKSRSNIAAKVLSAINAELGKRKSTLTLNTKLVYMMSRHSGYNITGKLLRDNLHQGSSPEYAYFLYHFVTETKCGTTKTNQEYLENWHKNMDLNYFFTISSEAWSVWLILNNEDKWNEMYEKAMERGVVTPLMTPKEAAEKVSTYWAKHENGRTLTYCAKWTEVKSKNSKSGTSSLKGTDGVICGMLEEGSEVYSNIFDEILAKRVNDVDHQKAGKLQQSPFTVEIGHELFLYSKKLHPDDPDQWFGYDKVNMVCHQKNKKRKRSSPAAAKTGRKVNKNPSGVRF